MSDSSLLYICSVEVGYLHPLGHKGMQSHFLPSVRVPAPHDEPNLSTLARFLRSDFLESKETPTKSRDTGLPSSLQLLLFQLSVTSTLQTLSEKDTDRGSFQHHYLSASRYRSKLPWLPVPCRAVSWLLWSVPVCYQPEHHASQPWPLHPPVGTGGSIGSAVLSGRG